MACVAFYASAYHHSNVHNKWVSNGQAEKIWKAIWIFVLPLGVTMTKSKHQISRWIRDFNCKASRK